MKRAVIVRLLLSTVIVAVLLTGCSSTGSASNDALGLAENEVALAAYQAGELAGAVGSLGTELSLPLWLVSGN